MNVMIAVEVDRKYQKTKVLEIAIEVQKVC